MNFPKLAFLSAVLLAGLGSAFAFGLYSGANQNAVYGAIRKVVKDLRKVYVVATGQDDAVLTAQGAELGPPIFNAEGVGVAPGLIFLSAVTADGGRSLRVIDRAGRVIHDWRPDWFEIWGDRGEFFDDMRPLSLQPIIQGALALANGDVVFNFRALSTVRMSPCGEVKWALENNGHHSVFIDDDGAIWVAGRRPLADQARKYQAHGKGFRRETLQKISPDGVLLREIDVFDVFLKNGYEGLAYLSSVKEDNLLVTGGTIHINDVEIFPRGMASEVFAPGDVMVSMRNINTFMVFDPDSLRIKFISTGEVLRQHDPDFEPNDIIAVFDNRNFRPTRRPDEDGSRIVAFDARTGAAEVIIDGARAPKFFTSALGAHDPLPTGGQLVISSKEGRILESGPGGDLLWEYHNRLEDTVNGLVTEAVLLPPEMDEAFFETQRAACQ